MRRFSNKNSGGGVFWVLFVCVFIILILSYFHISIQAVVESGDTQENFSYVIVNGKKIWDDYLKRPVVSMWNVLISVTRKLSNIDLELDPAEEEIPGEEATTP